jgi:sulfate/thiosulfate-binding protein
MSWLDQIKLQVVDKDNLPYFRKRSAEIILVLVCAMACLLIFQHRNRPTNILLNVAFDSSKPTLELLDQAWSADSKIKVSSLHAGSLQQTNALAKGLGADTICVSSANELDRLNQSKPGLIDPNWRECFPENSSPFSSSIVFILRPNAVDTINNWQDLLKSKQSIAIPDPRISGIGQYAYLALIHSIEESNGTSPFSLTTALQDLHLLPYAATRSTEAFLEDVQYDVLLTGENEAHRIMQLAKYKNFKIVYPSKSLKIEPVVAIVEKQVDQRGTRKAAEAYLNFYFSPKGQAIIEESGFKCRTKNRFEANESSVVSSQKLDTVEALFGSWQNAYKLHLGPNSSLTRLLEFRNALKGGSE